METPTPDLPEGSEGFPERNAPKLGPVPPAPTPKPRRKPRKSLPPAARARTEKAARAAARPALAAGRALSPPARAMFEMFRYWRIERQTLRQGMISLSISALGNIPTGLALGAMTGRLEALPGLFILIPAAIGMRGAIFGALGSRLGTALHAGMLRFTRDPRSRLGQNVYAATILTFTTSLYLAVAARVFSAATGLPTISIWDYVVISVLAGVMSSTFILVVTIWLARTGSRRGWDLDSVAAPIITFVGDFITLPTLFLASYVALEGRITFAIGMLSVAACVWAFVKGIRTKLPIARRIVRESAITLAVAGSVSLVAGTVVEHRVDRFLSFPALLVMLPAFLENAGALGGIASSRLASRLHLGSLRPRMVPERLAWLEISLLGPWSVLNFGATGLTSHYVATALGRASPGAARMTLIAIIAGTLATIGAAIVAYATAVATFRFELDPDNHGIAAVTSSMDLIGVLCIVGTVGLLGVS